MNSKPRLLVLYQNKQFSGPIEYTFRLLLSIIGLKGVICLIGSVNDQKIDPDQLIISYSDQIIDVGSHKHVHIFASTLFGNNYLSSSSLPEAPLMNINNIPIIYRGKSRVPGGVAHKKQTILTDADIIASTFYMVTCYEEVIKPALYDKHGRFEVTESLSYREGFLKRPIVHEYAELLRSWITTVDHDFDIYRPWKGRDFAVCITHDIDSLRRYSYPPIVTVSRAIRSGNYRRALGIIREYGRVMTGRQSEPYNTFNYLLDKELEHGFIPTYYFMAGRYGLKGHRSQDYRLIDDNVQEILHTLKSAGCEIGLHSSYDAFEHPDLLEKEKNELEQALGHSISGLRQHYMRFKAPESWQKWQEAGFEYDTTVSFAREEGFRTGICIPYHPFDVLQNRELTLWEVPLTVMEGTLFEYQRLGGAEVGKRLEQLVNIVANVRGLFVLLWHNSFFDELVYPGVHMVYEQLIASLAARRPLGISVLQAIQQWSTYEIRNEHSSW